MTVVCHHGQSHFPHQRRVAVVKVLAAAFLFFTDNLKCIGLPFHKEKAAVEQVEAAPAEAPAAEAPAGEAPAEAAPAA